MAHVHALRIRAVRRSPLPWSPLAHDGLLPVCATARSLLASPPQQQQQQQLLHGVEGSHGQAVPVPVPVGGWSSPWGWNPHGVRSFHTRSLSQLVASRGSKRLCLVDTLALVRRLESQGLTSKQAEAITAVITDVLNDILENVGQTFTSIHEAQRSEMMAEAALSKFKAQIQSSQEHHFSMLQQELERLRTDIDKMRNESKYAIDKVTSGQRLDLNLERGRIRDELAAQATETSELTNKLDREIHSLKTQLEAAKFDVIKYCIGTIVSLTAVGLGMLRLIM
ncbi:hypothetical protein M758_4G272300 [Ceratodon purpureus]|nr:hypothetical protein M758_4G272300 [Ceratodon purpureus]